jgi:hypothetical protein
MGKKKSKLEICCWAGLILVALNCAVGSEMHATNEMGESPCKSWGFDLEGAGENPCEVGGVAGWEVSENVPEHA